MTATSAPLAFSQLAHWNTYGLDRRPSACVIPLALRLRGPVNVPALKQSCLAVISRHDALRSRIVQKVEPVQYVFESCDTLVTIQRAAAPPGGWESAGLERLLLSFIPERIDLSRDPLSGVSIVELGNEDCAVLMYMEHIISDGFSVTVAARDLLRSYQHEMRRSAAVAEARPLQCWEYARAQRESHGKWLAIHGAYIADHFNGCGRVRIPHCRPGISETRGGWGVTKFRFDEHLVKLGQAASRRCRTTLVLGVFTAYAAFVARWCDAYDMVVLFQSDGRSAGNCGDSIGYFAFPLYIRILMDRSDTLMDLTGKVVSEYCSALEHADYGWMESRIPRPEFTRNTCFNWLPKGALAQKLGVSPTQSVTVADLPIDTCNLGRLERDTEPMIGIVGSSHEIEGGVYFNREALGEEGMKQFAGAFLRFAADLWNSPTGRIVDIELWRAHGGES